MVSIRPCDSRPNSSSPFVATIGGGVGDGAAHAEAALATAGAILVLERADDLVRVLGDREGVLALAGAGRHGRGGGGGGARADGIEVVEEGEEEGRSSGTGSSAGCMHPTWVLSGRCFR